MPAMQKLMLKIFYILTPITDSPGNFILFLHGSIASIINSEQMGWTAVLVDGMPWLHLRDDPPLISRRRLAADSLFQPQQTSNNSAVDFRGLRVYQASVRNGPRLTLVITPPMSSPRVALLISKMESSESNFLPVQGPILESFTAETSSN